MGPTGKQNRFGVFHFVSLDGEKSAFNALFIACGITKTAIKFIKAIDLCMRVFSNQDESEMPGSMASN